MEVGVCACSVYKVLISKAFRGTWASGKQDECTARQSWWGGVVLLALLLPTSCPACLHGPAETFPVLF